MSRRRATNPTKAISVTMKESTLNELHHKLSDRESRSKYIQESVDIRLSPTQTYISDASTNKLMAALRVRDDCDQFLHKLLSQLLGIDSLV
jgi:hypothetical protein